ncbi:NADPH-dependent FMN reductase [Streptomyces sp. NPDC001668]|uniref:NADPH-dependent FMN reductase n=1 Tax=unclassified Streptomyces TaxID=2593676 RepID=UPI00367CAEFC
MTNVLVLPGSSRSGSFSTALARYAADRVAEAGAGAWLWDHRQRPLPPADPEYHDRPADHPDRTVRELEHLASRCDAFVLVTPVYHNSYSGLLKNCLDHLTMHHFRMKPVVLLGHGPRLTAVQAVDHLRTVVRGLYGLALPAQAVTTPADYGSDAEDRPRLKDPALCGRVTEAVTMLLRTAGHRAEGRS